jgi:hypothetical protein
LLSVIEAELYDVYAHMADSNALERKPARASPQSAMKPTQ